MLTFFLTLCKFEETEQFLFSLLDRWEGISDSIEQINGWTTVEIAGDKRLSEKLYKKAICCFDGTYGILIP